MFRYTPEMIQYLAENFPVHAISSLTNLFNDQFGTNKTPEQLHSAMKCRGIRAGVKRGNIGPVKYTEKQLEFIRTHYPSCSRKELLVKFNETFGLDISLSQLIGITKNHNIKSGRTGRFKKGNIPWSTGLAGKGICKAGPTAFKPGHVPTNTKDLGSERKSDGYTMVKIRSSCSCNNYELKHRVLWEENHGTIPENHVIAFKDGNKSNLAIDNLICVSRDELLILNKSGYQKAPEELKPTIMAVSKLKTTMHKRIRA